MKISEMTFDAGKWSAHEPQSSAPEAAQLVFVFGDRDTLQEATFYDGLKAMYADAHIIGCSSSGNILGASVRSEQAVAVAVAFDHGHVELVSTDFTVNDNLEATGYELVRKLPQEGLRHVFILSDGIAMNGSSLARGTNRALNHKIPVTGGLAGDGTAFEETWVIADAHPGTLRVAAVGFYGVSLHVESGCYAGWDEFGRQRTITRSDGNVLYEIDGEPALELYKKYLGPYADELPGSALRFPLSIKTSQDDTPIIRTILGIDETHQTLTFAGDVPQGSLARLMQTNIDGLIDGAQTAANAIGRHEGITGLGLIVSCVGRRLVLKAMTDEELESIAKTLGDTVKLIGFYSYGELAPFSDNLATCQLHNQTMTLTVIYEMEHEPTS